jgi:hypothetical protein
LIARVTLTTSTSAEFCFNIPLEDFIDFHQVLIEESNRLRKEANNGK